MLQYLLNTTAIWLISLVMFDLFLRRESYHSYNRFYLLFTFLLGAFLPLLHWQNNDQIYETAIAKPIQQVITLKESIVNTTAAPTDTSINWQQWLFIIYLAGVFVVLCLLVTEIIKLSSAFTTKRSYEGSWTVIETGKEHAPFSFLNTLFVCSRAQYNDEEWSMILSHEKRHTSLFHIADLLLMQLGRILFWFHPLVYLYNNRLLLVHEYQADNTSARQPQVYGKFLIEQALLQSAPSLSHSFNRSPIKNRILMLTRRSSAAARTKMLVFIPLLLVCVLCFSKNIFARGDHGKPRPIVTLNNIPDTTLGLVIDNYDIILSDPRLDCRVPGVKITGFMVSFQPKGEDYIGPYEVKGSADFNSNEKIIETLKKLKESKNELVKIFIENIHVEYKGADIIVRPIIIRVQPGGNKGYAVKLTNQELGHFSVLTGYDQLLKDPSLVGVGCEIMSFRISFDPGNNYLGPFLITGSQINGKSTCCTPKI